MSNLDGKSDRLSRIRDLNNDLRVSMDGGRIVMTQGITALDPDQLLEVMQKVRMFDDFNPNNDPHSEHDFGGFDHEGEKIFWKIDYYDKTCRWGSPTRVSYRKRQRKGPRHRISDSGGR